MTTTPIRFHEVHGNNIRIDANGNKATRVESFNQALCFTNRPLEAHEKLFITVTEVSRAWSGTLRLGLTCNNPATLRNNLPKFCCPDLTMRPGFWGKAVPDSNAQLNQSFSIYYTNDRRMVYESSTGEVETFLTGVAVTRPLYAIFDIYGNTKSIKIDVRGVSPAPALPPRKAPTELVTTKSESFGSITLRPCPLVPKSAQNITAVPEYATNTEPYGKGLVTVVSTITRKQGIIVKINEVLGFKQTATFALSTETAEKIHAKGNLEKLCDDSYTIPFDVSISNNKEIAVYLDEQGNVLTSGCDGEKWEQHFCVDPNLSYRLVMELDNIKHLTVLGTTEDLRPVNTQEKSPKKNEKSSDPNEETICVVCLESTREVLIEPCNHFVLCMGCSNGIGTGGQCPVCRSLIKSTKRIFMA